MPLDWQECMVSVVGQVAGRTGFANVGIQRGEHNKWLHVQPGETEPHLTLEQARAAYDRPAARLGFKEGGDGDWYKPASTFAVDA